MKSATKTRAFVLQKYPYQESSFVCHCFNENFGKVKFILFGATKKQSRLKNYQLGSIIEMNANYSQNSEWLKTYQNHTLLEIIPNSYTSFCALSFVLEFIYRSDFDSSNSAKIFHLYQDFYQKINDSEEFTFSILQIFTQLIQLIGFYPRFDACFICKQKTYKINQQGEVIFRKENYTLKPAQSGLICSQCHDSENNLNSAHIKIFLYFKNGQKKISLLVDKISSSILKTSFQSLLESYAFYYPVQNLRSLSVLYDILGIEGDIVK